MSYVLNTNVVSELSRSIPHKSIVTWIANTAPEDIYICSLTLAEIRKGVERLPTSKKKTHLKNWIEKVLLPLVGDRILAVDEFVAEHWGFTIPLLGRTLPIIDSFIAAAASLHHLTIVTHNTKDFIDFPRLTVVNPF